MTPKLFTRINLYLILAIVFIIAGCPCEIIKEDFGTISGSVTDINKSPLADVKITIDDKIIYSLEDGSFSIDQVLLGQEKVMHFSKPNYIENQKVVDIMLDQNSLVFAALGKWDNIEIINPSNANTVGFQNAMVELPANSIVDENGNAFFGDVTVKAAYFDPLSNNYEHVFPGDFQGENYYGITVPIESFGFN